MLQCIIDVTLKLIKPQLKELSSKKSRIKCQKTLSNHLNSYICVHKYRENAYNVIIYGHNSCYQCRVAIDKSAVEKGRKVPEYAYRRKQGVG